MHLSFLRAGRAAALSLPCVLAAGACGGSTASETSPSPDGGTDAGPDTSSGGQPEAGTEAGADARPDGTADGGVDAPVGEAGQAQGSLTACNGIPAPPPPSNSRCAASLCGNGKIDPCTAPNGHASSEACDGADLGTLSCTALGFAGGTLSCTSRCLLDDEACESCAAGARTTACTHAPLGVPPASIAVAATATEIDVAWVEAVQPTPPAKPRTHFTRFAPDFHVLSDTSCFGPADAMWVSLAPSSAGWLVSVAGGAGDHAIVALDASGNVTGTHAPSGVGSDAIVPVLTAGPSGALLLTWVDGFSSGGLPTGTFHAQPLAADGTPTGKAATIANGGLSWAATGTSDGFVVAVVVEAPAPGTEHIQLAHVAADGTLATGDAIASEQASGLSLAWSGTDVRFAYESFAVDQGVTGPDTFFQHVTAAAALSGTAQKIEVQANDYGAYPLLPVGADTVILRSPDTGSITRLDLWRRDASGADVWPAVSVARSGAIQNQALVMQGGDAVVAWIDANSLPDNGDVFPWNDVRLSFARVRITP